MKALALLSGGLDSILAARLVMDQGVEVIGVSFESPFFGAAKAGEAARELGIELVVVDIGEELLEIVASPKHGYGKHLNPCIDCHALMLRRAGRLLDELGASFVVTGEVVGQRPKSQMRFGLRAVESESGLDGLLLRPLSARLLEPTVPEREGWVDRSTFLDLHGRTRKPQLELAERYGITTYESPAGGCLLADENVARGVRDLLEHGQLTIPAARIVAVGRQFRLSPRARLAVGRNHAENEVLSRQRPEDASFVKVVEHKGPLGVLTGLPGREDEELAARVVARYADTEGGAVVRVRIWGGPGGSRTIEVMPLDPRTTRSLAI